MGVYWKVGDYCIKSHDASETGEILFCFQCPYNKSALSAFCRARKRSTQRGGNMLQCFHQSFTANAALEIWFGVEDGIEKWFKQIRQRQLCFKFLTRFVNRRALSRFRKHGVFVVVSMSAGSRGPRSNSGGSFVL